MIADATPVNHHIPGTVQINCTVRAVIDVAVFHRHVCAVLGIDPDHPAAEHTTVFNRSFLAVVKSEHIACTEGRCFGVPCSKAFQRYVGAPVEVQHRCIPRLSQNGHQIFTFALNGQVVDALYCQLITVISFLPSPAGASIQSAVSGGRTQIICAGFESNAGIWRNGVQQLIHVRNRYFRHRTSVSCFRATFRSGKHCEAHYQHKCQCGNNYLLIVMYEFHTLFQPFFEFFSAFISIHSFLSRLMPGEQICYTGRAPFPG